MYFKVWKSAIMDPFVTFRTRVYKVIKVKDGFFCHFMPYTGCRGYYTCFVYFERIERYTMISGPGYKKPKSCFLKSLII